MCGIIAGITVETPILPLLLEGLERLEYRGYDSAGFAVANQQQLLRMRAPGKVKALIHKAQGVHADSRFGIAHTRWATHGKPSEANAHPHLIDGRLLIVHNGIIENYRELHARLGSPKLQSETDTEVFGWAVLREITENQLSLREALEAATRKCQGSYAATVIDLQQPETLAAIRCGSPLVLGTGNKGVFVASDPLAMIHHTGDFVFLDEQESIIISRSAQDPLQIEWAIYQPHNRRQKRQPQSMVAQQYATDKGDYDHYMLKEIDQQPQAIAATLDSMLRKGSIDFGSPSLMENLAQAQAVQMVACGTSAHAAMVARYWMEEIAGIHCWVEVASEFRYRQHASSKDVLYLTLSQSGETADTLESLRLSRSMDYLSRLAITNSPYSTIVREADHSLITQCGVEVSVASTKAFTTQLLVLLLCTLAIARARGKIDDKGMSGMIKKIHALPQLLQGLLDKRDEISHMANELVGKNGIMFLGRHTMFPVALEGALKLKEIAYIHAEAYPAGELKHGPIALIDSNTPVVAVSPPGELLHKLHTNLEEVQARGAVMLLFIDTAQKFVARPFDRIMKLPRVGHLLAPFVYTIPLQLLAYYTAAKSGTDVDKPRNLAKSVTVE